MKDIRAIKSDTGAQVTNDREIENILNKHFATTGEKLAGLLIKQPLRANSRAHRSNIPNRYVN
jgi:hypothetical protein